MFKRKGLSVILAAAVAVSPFVAEPKAYALKSFNVTADDDAAGEESEYELEFKIEKSLDEDDTITVKFDSDFEIDEDIRKSRVTVNGRSANDVEVDGQEIIIEIPEDLDVNETVTIVIEEGITNPDDGGTYSVWVKTQKEKSYVKDTVKIVEDSDGDFKVSVSDSKAGNATSYEIKKFYLSSRSDDLVKGEWITVTFPLKDMLPRSIDPEDVKLNGEEPSDVEVDDDEVSIKIPSKVDGDDYIQIVFNKSAGITNPKKADDYTLVVEYDGIKYKSEEFEIKSNSSSGSGSSDFTVTLSDRSPGARSSYSFEVDLGDKKLYANNQIEVEFPSLEMVPPIIDSNSVTINGEKARNVISSGRKVFMSAPSGFSSASKVKVEFSLESFITNPKTAGSYQLTAKMAGKTFTSKKFEISGTSNSPVATDNSTATISLTKPTPGTATGINVAIKGLGVGLAGNNDFIELVLPAGFTVPAAIQPSSVTVNGVAASFVAARGNNLVIYPSQNLNTNTAVNVAISESANIVTPAAANTYTISVYTSEERNALFARQVSVAQPVPASAARLRIGVASFTQNGVTKALKAAPYTVNGYTLVPVDFFRDAFGLTTQINGNTAVIISGSTVIRFTVGSDQAQIGTTKVKLPVAVQAKDGTPMVPVRYIADLLKYTIGWDAATNTVVMYK